MQTLTFGQIPKDFKLDKPYNMRLNGQDFNDVASIVNQGIDSHLEAVMTKQDGNSIDILDTDSMRCFLRRCTESDNDNLRSLASGIMQTLNYEWI